MTSRSDKVNLTILQATNSILDTLSSSYGPCGLDKIITKDKNTTITNDGATILKFFNLNPIHKVLSSVSKAQDINCGDGTTSVIILSTILFEYLNNLKIHPSILNESLKIAKGLILGLLDNLKEDIYKIGDKNNLMNIALTVLNSKVVSKDKKIAKIAIEALSSSKISDITIIKKNTKNIDDIKFYNGFILNGLKSNYQNLKTSGKVLILQFPLSTLKTDVDFNIELKNYQQMQNFYQEEREYIIDLIKKINKLNPRVVILQKNLLKESVSDLARHFLKKLNILFFEDVDRKIIEKLTKSFNSSAISDPEFLNENSGFDADIEINENLLILSKKHLNLSSIVLFGVDSVIIDEVERSLNDVLCVVSLLKNNSFILPGGCSVELNISNLLEKYEGKNALIIKEIGKAFSSMAHYLCKNAGIDTIKVINNIKKNLDNNKNLGISINNANKNYMSDMINNENIIQPWAVNKSFVILAIETVQMLLKIDDILPLNK